MSGSPPTSGRPLPPHGRAARRPFRLPGSPRPSASSTTPSRRRRTSPPPQPFPSTKTAAHRAARRRH
jgi:hypothetical protein